MKVNLERSGKNIVQLNLELESEKTLRAYEAACRQLSHKVDIPGFRKGKAPRNIIEKALGMDYIKREALEHLIPELINNAIIEEKLDIITQPQVETCKFELGEPLALTTTFEVRPEVNLGDYQKLTIPVPKAMLPADAVDQALIRVAESKAIHKAVPVRPIVMGDSVVLDFECFVDGKLVKGGKAQGLVLEIKEGNFVDGFCEQLTGKEPETHHKLKVKFPENYRNKELAGQDADFEVDIKEIREKIIPAIDDELAKQVGQESLDKLKEAIHTRLDVELHQENESLAQKAVVEAVVTRSNVDIPDTMIERECQLLLNQLKQVIERNGQNWDTYQASPEFENLKQSKRTEAQQRVLTSLVLGAVIRAENMNVSQEETSLRLAELASQYNVPLERIAGNNDLIRQVMEEVLTQKVIQFLLSNNQLQYDAQEAVKASETK